MAQKRPSQMFKVIDVIGRGQFGNVFKIQDLRNENAENPLFAAKIQPLRSRQDYLICQKEINLLRNACESFFPKLFLAFELTKGQCQKQSVIVMELGRGTLEDLGRPEMKSIELSQTIQLWILRKIADALEYIHFTCKIMHGDIKPSNILFNQNYVPILCDLGFAERMKDTADAKKGLGVGIPHSCQGTLTYKPYEYLMKSFYGVRSDMWAWACTAYFLFTKQQLMCNLSYVELICASQPNENTPSIYIMEKLRAINDPAVPRFLQSFFCKIDDRPDKIHIVDGYQRLFGKAIKLSFADYLSNVNGLFDAMNSLKNVTSTQEWKGDSEMQNVLDGEIKEFSYASLGYDESEHGVKTAERSKGRFVKKENLIGMKRCNHMKRRKTALIVSDMRRRSHKGFREHTLKQVLRNSPVRY